MDLRMEFQGYLKDTLQVAKQDKILLAVSGGRDSMLMAYLFQQTGCDCVIAHCNFQLRGAESDKDEELVKAFAAQAKIPFFVKHFETEAYASEKRISIQMAARDLRYAWFDDLSQELGTNWIAVAQHHNDHIETVLLNLTRGTGLLGLQGILPKRGKLIRPLLFLNSSQVTTAVQDYAIPFRDDQSNFVTKYARNKVRLEIVPKFQEIAPDFELVMAKNIQHFQEANALLQSFINPIRELLFVAHGEAMYSIERKALAQYTSNMPLLFELFRPFGFSKEVLADMLGSWEAESGRRFQSASHELLLDRSTLFLRPIADTANQEGLLIFPEILDFNFANQQFLIHYTEDTQILQDKSSLQVDADRLIFPLQLRYWQEGDIFYPLGMQGRQKLSDFFTQKKLSVFEKNQVPLLLNGNGELIWVVGYRMDNRYKMTESTKKVFTLVVN